MQDAIGRRLGAATHLYNVKEAGPVQRVLITRNTAGRLVVFKQESYTASYGVDWSTSEMLMPHAIIHKLCAEPWCTRTMFKQLEQPKPDAEQVLPSVY